MLLRENPESFLTGDDPFIPTSVPEADSLRVNQAFAFAPEHEGFIGIPHGGLAMGLCLDAWRRSGNASYPIDVRFKFGGSGVHIGDPVIFTVDGYSEGQGPPFVAKITKQGDKTPYVRAEITPAGDSSRSGSVSGPPSPECRPLPYYKNCFVCGHHRDVIGLQRRFRVHPPNGGNLVTTEWGGTPDDVDRAQSFLIGKEELHPAILISIFDENTAWGGFMQTGSGGLSVKLDFTLLRPVASTEHLIFVGWPAGTRGNPRNPRFFLAEGTILSMNGRGNPEPVAYGRGEWIIMDLYTKQIKENLLPHDDWEWIFPAEIED